MKKRSLIGIALLILVGVSGALAQTPSMKPSVAAGDVTSIDAGKIVLQTKDGSLNVTLSDKTEYKRVPPENPSLKAAVPSALADIGVGDKLMVTGIFSDDKTTLPARAVYLMTKSDIAQKQVKDGEKWATRGISGRVASVDPVTRQIKIDVRGMTGSTSVVLSPKEGAKLHRYAPNSVKFSEAKESTLTEIQPGDMLRALGDRSADGASFAAEEIITGAFRTVAGKVKSVDVAKNEVVITDEGSKKDITIDLASATTLKKFPEEWAQRMAAMQSGQGGMRPGGGPPGGGAARPQANGAPTGGQTGAAGPGGGPGRGPGGARGGIDDMLERFPNITAADLKVGEMIAISSSKSNTPDHMVAIKLLAGVEPFIRVAQAQAAAGGGQRGGGGLSLDIPGLDGFGGP
ncbi:MAG TPA: hypothetical protein VJV05_13615 [Pyrinomonadaceae bacterium]|nr:hypothetical protein [Pyrinomonadaceae bacterium]